MYTTSSHRMIHVQLLAQGIVYLTALNTAYGIDYFRKTGTREQGEKMQHDLDPTGLAVSSVAKHALFFLLPGSAHEPAERHCQQDGHPATAAAAAAAPAAAGPSAQRSAPPRQRASGRFPTAGSRALRRRATCTLSTIPPSAPLGTTQGSPRPPSRCRSEGARTLR